MGHDPAEANPDPNLISIPGWDKVSLAPGPDWKVVKDEAALDSPGPRVVVARVGRLTHIKSDLSFDILVAFAACDETVTAATNLSLLEFWFWIARWDPGRVIVALCPTADRPSLRSNLVLSLCYDEWEVTDRQEVPSGAEAYCCGDKMSEVACEDH